jgi:putative hemolysin
LIYRPIARWLGLDWVNHVYNQICDAPGADAFASALRHVGIDYELDPGEFGQVPQSGRLIVIANHPFGCADALMLCQIIGAARPDVRVLANYLVGSLRPLRDRLILVNPFGGRHAAAANVAPMREAIRWLDAEGVLGLFPAGEVAHWRTSAGRVTDPPWSAALARLARMSEAPVLPVFFEGRNSLLFSLAGLLHPRLRTALLARELRRLAGQKVRVRIGRVIPFQLLSEMDDREMTEHLRRVTFDLAQAPDKRRDAPIIRPIAANHLAADIAALPPASTLLRSGDFEVICAGARLIPHVLDEIGRLREISFRAAGEGTGQRLDLDRFDRDYTHLLLWHRLTQQVIGAYRLGQTEKLLGPGTVAGLYTATLFDFSRAGIARLNPGLELGRSFVRPEFQKSHQPLMLLWKGVCRFIARNPRYAVCFGAVSISQQYRLADRQLIVQFMQAHHRLSGAETLVRPRRPWPGRGSRSLRARQPLGPRKMPPAMPVLLRQYLKMGAKLLDVSVDPDFGNCLDALLMIDLRHANRRMLDHYMGPACRREFLVHHGVVGVACEAPQPLVTADLL